MRIPPQEFERLVAQAIESLPAEFREKLENVEVIIEQRYPPGTPLLGLYYGVPLTQRSVWAAHLLPDRITIFQGPIESICRTREEIVAQVRRVVLHEIAHHFGISDQRLRELGC
jgi:predicted Zn-dependent protease with MMP-like domain